MGTYLTPEFVERRVSTLTSKPDGWNADPHRTLYQLDLKMCQIKSLVFSFEWGKESVPAPRLASVLDTPSRILRMDVSLNELTFLPHDGLLPFRNLRALDASLNKITNCQGVEVLHHLYSLNLAHNALRRVDNLAHNISLVELNLSMNEIRDISSMPSLMNLRFLNLSNNNLDNLDGVSSLPKLEELNIQRNHVVDIVPIMSCLHLRMLNAAENRISDLDKTAAVLAKMYRMQVLCLYGNPIDRQRHYQTDILRNTNIMTLDNVTVRPLPRVDRYYTPLPWPRHVTTPWPRPVQNSRHYNNIVTLKEAARQAFQERMRAAKSLMEENAQFMHKRIRSLQDEYKDFEYRMRTDLDVCLRYLDTLSTTDAGKMDYRDFDFHFGRSSPWEPQTPRSGRNTVKNDYTGVRDTDEVLKCAYNELSKEQDRLDSV